MAPARLHLIGNERKHFSYRDLFEVVTILYLFFDVLQNLSWHLNVLIMMNWARSNRTRRPSSTFPWFEPERLATVRVASPVFQMGCLDHVDSSHSSTTMLFCLVGLFFGKIGRWKSGNKKHTRFRLQIHWNQRFPCRKNGSLRFHLVTSQMAWYLEFLNEMCRRFVP